MYKQIILYMGKTKLKRGQVTCLGPHTQLMAARSETPNSQHMAISSTLCCPVTLVLSVSWKANLGNKPQVQTTSITEEPKNIFTITITWATSY